MAYYYLAAQLPYLRYGEAPPMSSASFRELARTSLEGEDAFWLDACVPAGGGAARIDAGEAPEFFFRYREWEDALRLNLARARAAKAKRELAVTPPDFPQDAAAAAKAAAALDSPLDAELVLDEARWKAIELFQGLDYFSRNTMYAYLLKLLLMERRAAFKPEDGRAHYNELYAAVMEASESGFHGARGASSGEPK